MPRFLRYILMSVVTSLTLLAVRLLIYVMFVSPHVQGESLQAATSFGRNFFSSSRAGQSAAPRMGATDWVVFSDADVQTGARIRHARLMSLPQAAASPGVMLELQQGAEGFRRTTLSLSGPCPPVPSISARFDGGAEFSYAVSGGSDSGRCVLVLDADDRFAAAVADADTLVFSAPKLAAPADKITFKVTGLLWQ